MQITRRTFLAGTTALAGITTAPKVRVYGNTKRAAANGRITIGSTGLGPRGRQLLPHFLRQPDGQFMAIANVQAARWENW